MGQIGIITCPDSIIKPEQERFPQYRGPGILGPEAANQMPGTREAQGPENYHHDKNGRLAAPGTAEQEDMFSPAPHQRQGLPLYRRRFKYHRYRHLLS
jgi:hypothetical protein